MGSDGDCHLKRSNFKYREVNGVPPSHTVDKGRAKTHIKPKSSLCSPSLCCINNFHHAGCPSDTLRVRHSESPSISRILKDLNFLGFSKLLSHSDLGERTTPHICPRIHLPIFLERGILPLSVSCSHSPHLLCSLDPGCPHVLPLNNSIWGSLYLLPMAP